MALSKILSDLLEQDKIAKFTKTGNATATLGSLTLSTAVSGAGGLDTGTIAASTFYYVYTVVSSNAVKLVASTSAISPTGFTQYKKVGAFYTDSSSNIFKAYFFGEVNMTVLSAKVSAAGVVSGENIEWLNGPAVITLTSVFTAQFNSDIFTVTPNCTYTAIDTSASNWEVRIISANSNSSQMQYMTGSSTNSGGFAFALGVRVICQKTGIDATMPDWSRV